MNKLLTILNFKITQDMDDKIESFRIEQGIHNKSEAVRVLLGRALKALEEPPPERKD